MIYQGFIIFFQTVKIGQELAGNRQELELLLLNLDHFRNVNETYGYLTGNKLLMQFAAALRYTAGKRTVIGRMGGDIFLVLLPAKRWGNDGAKEIVERLAQRRYVADPELPPVALEFSWGIAQGAGKVNGFQDLMQRAERALQYQREVKRANFPEVEGGSEFQEFLNVLAEKDVYTYVHSLQVAHYGAFLAGLIGMSVQEIHDIRVAGWLHDLGKIAIPNGILRKNDQLDELEYQLIQQHVKYGLQLITTRGVNDFVCSAVGTHHERYDGRGYPHGYTGNDIPREGRILAIADSFAAMTVKRVYRRPMSCEEALQELVREKGRQFDPFLVERFVSCFSLLQESRVSCSGDNSCAS